MRRTNYKNIYWYFLDYLPPVISIIIAGFSFSIVLLLLLHQYYLSYIFLLGTFSSTIPILLFFKNKQWKPELSKERNICNVVAILFVMTWVLFNIFFTAHSVFITRDPGIYANAGKWLVNHSTTNIETAEVTPYKERITNQSSGMWRDGRAKERNIIQPQGMHLLPGFLGLAGRIFGDISIFKLNVVFGGAALLMIYSFAKLLIKPRWALLALSVMAATLPMIYFSRDTYTEALAACFTFACLTFLLLAQKEFSNGRKNKTLWVIAGFMAGVGTLTRPDAYLTLAALLIFLGIFILVNRTQKGIGKYPLAFIIGALPSALLSYLDITYLTTSYYVSLRKDIFIQLFLVGVATSFVLLVALFARKLPFINKLDKKTFSWRAKTIACIIILIFTLLTLRPLFYKAYASGGHGVGFVNSVQGQLGYQIEARKYSENSMEWLAWYIGLPSVMLGILGLAIASSKMMHDKKLFLLPFIGVFGLTALIYIPSPRITADQIWAARRFLPVIMPGLIVFAAYCLDTAEVKFANYKDKTHIFLALVASIWIIGQPLIISRPFLFRREKGADLRSLSHFCDTLPERAVVIWLASTLENSSSQSTRSFCGIESLGYDYHYSDSYKANKTLDKTVLRRVYQDSVEQGYIPVIAIHGSQKPSFSPEVTNNFEIVSVYDSQALERTLTSAPRNMVKVDDSIEMSYLQADGSLARPKLN